ncbi:MAG: tetratricopeptide repeat protein, partial [Blastocatellia bacterium]
TEPSLAGAKPELDALQAKIDEKLEVLDGKRQADADEKAFFKHHDSALFTGVDLAGGDLQRDVGATITSCKNGLALFDLAEGASTPTFPKYLTRDRQKECEGACYRLLVIWARAEAPSDPDAPRPNPGQIAAAFKRLEQAARLQVKLELAATQALHQHRADLFDFQGDVKKAQAERASAAALRPGGALDYFLTGYAHMRQGRPREAADAFGIALHENPSDFWGSYFQGMCKLQLQKHGEAQTYFSNCLGARRDFVWGYVMRGFAAGQLNNFHAAFTDFETGLKLDGPDGKARYGILVNQGNLFLRQAQQTNKWVAAPAWRPLTPTIDFVTPFRVDRLAAAAECLMAAQKHDRGRYEAYVFLAQVRLEQGRPDLAAPLLDEALAVAEKRLDQSDTESARKSAARQKAIVHRYRARFRHEQGSWQAALDDLDEAMVFAIADDFSEQGHLLNLLRRPKEALIAFNKALEMRTGQADDFRGKAEALLALGKDKEAAAAIDACLEINPKGSADLFRARGAIHVNQWQYSAAIGAYGKAVELQPDSATLTSRGWAYLNMGVPTEAVKDFQKAIDLDNKNAEAYCGRGLIRAGQSKQVQAQEDAAKALALGGEKPDFQLLWNISHIHAEMARVARSKGLKPDIYLDQAVGKLERAFNGMDVTPGQWYWRNYIAKDVWLEPLKDQERYKKLRRIYGG